jgi:multiple sugar transport system substrate-binding protein
MNKRFFLYALLLAAVLVFGLSLPMAVAQDTTPTAAPTATPAILEAGTGEIQLQFWHGLTGGEGTVLAGMIQQFVEENPDISVHSEAYLWVQFFQKLQAAFISGSPPDVFIMHAHEIPHYASLGILRPSDELLDTAGGTLPSADFAQPAFDITNYNGQHYGVLLDNHGFGTYLNPAAFERAGVEVPEELPTGDELIELARQLTIDANGNHPGDEGFDVNNVEQWGIGIEWPLVSFQSLLPQFGGRIVSDDLQTVTVNSPEGIAALQFLYDLIHVHNVAPDPATLTGHNAFVSGNAAIVGNGTWFQGALRDQAPDIEYEVRPMWQGGPNPGTWFAAHAIFLSPTLEGERLEAAQRFVQFMSENGQTWAEQTGHVPARISGQEAMNEDEFPVSVIFGQGFQEGGLPVPPLPNVSEVVGAALDQEVVAALNNQKTPEQALNDAAARMQQILDRGA